MEKTSFFTFFATAALPGKYEQYSHNCAREIKRWNREETCKKHQLQDSKISLTTAKNSNSP